ncbi:WecB/TagA/CpsF family glycosyltransferase [Arenibacter algicola]|uniref:Putative N-acetylmannosaminyltransferase n=1 Tax=Arenibacter algicola TaxID=616991 RepID=A0A221V315_9FLAO|nr:WecB/TagA/CpsF family glycosyltransferase [Arenibacter algicola]ASO07979.1 putative N-acetylmannosaminyltransferase [Arenibacter algicola]
MNRFFIDKIGISKVNLNTTLKFIIEAIENKKYGYVCVTNARTVYISNHDSEYCKIQNDSLLTIPDGMPLVWIANNKGVKEVNKTSGKDLMDEIFKISVEKGYSHYFYGCSQETIDLLRKNIRTLYPGLDIKAAISPPFQPLGDYNIEALATEVNALSPTFFWCGLGAPKQERLMALLQPHLQKTIAVGVGLAFEYFAGTVKRVPEWMQKSGLEWSYRLAQQPKNIKRAIKPLSWVFFKLIASKFF